MIFIENVDSAWGAFLDSEGIPYRKEISKNTRLFFVYSSQAYFRILDGSYKNDISIIICTKLAIQNGLTNNQFETTNTIYSSLDFACYDEVGCLLSTDCAKVHISSSLGRKILWPSVDIDSLMFSGRRANKRILVDRDHSYQDNLTFVDKRNLRSYMTELLDVAFDFLQQPILSIWKHPKVTQASFNLRVDVDPEKNTSESEAFDKIKATFVQLDKWKDRVTFAINMYRWLPKFNFFQEQSAKGFDIQSHCYYHYHYPLKSINRKNISTSHFILKDHDIHASGFVSPENFFTSDVYEYLQKLNYKYVSSFGYDYINYPHRPLVNGRLASFYEITADPMVLSKINQFCDTTDIKLVNDYYKKSITSTLSQAGETCFKYEHPAVLGKFPSIVNTIMATIDEYSEINFTTLTKFSEWLHQRSNLLDKVELSFNKSNNVIDLTYHEDRMPAEDLSEFGVKLRIPFQKSFKLGLLHDHIREKDMTIYSSDKKSIYSQPVGMSGKLTTWYSSIRGARKLVQSFTVMKGGGFRG